MELRDTKDGEYLAQKTEIQEAQRQIATLTQENLGLKAKLAATERSTRSGQRNMVDTQ